MAGKIVKPKSQTVRPCGSRSKAPTAGRIDKRPPGGAPSKANPYKSKLK